MVKYSIIIPVYNVERYLDTCIQSIIDQDYQHFEILLVNDGSKDSSGQICTSWSEKDSRVIVIHQENLGAGAARNTGIRVAQGTYVLFLDGDDYWLSPTALSSIDRQINQSEPDVLIFNLRKTYGKTLDAPYFTATPHIPPENTTDEMITYLAANHLWTACVWNKAIKTTVLHENQLNFIEGGTAEDIEWCGRLALFANSFDYLDSCVVGYRQRATSVTGTVNIKKIQCLLDNILICTKLSTQAGSDKKELLESYTAFQFATLLYGYAALPKSSQKKSFLPHIRKLEYLLNLSTHPKVKLIRYARAMLGLQLTLFLLSVWTFINSHQKARRD